MVTPSEKWTYWDLLLTYTNLVFVHFYVPVYYGNFCIKPSIFKYIHIDSTYDQLLQSIIA